MNRLLLAVAVTLLTAGCAQLPATPALQDAVPSNTMPADDPLVSFSVGPGNRLSHEWEPLIIHRAKKPTSYRLVTEHDNTVLHARAVAASSGLMQDVSIDPAAKPWLNWRWRIGNLIATANNFQRDAEDSPVRIILGFDGDKDALPFNEQIMFETVKVLTGREMPYATLMYVWENKAPVGTVIANTRSGRVKMMVAASGGDGIGQWHEFTRHIVEDFEKAFGEKPGRLIGVGILTDTDNTGETVDAWYGDIRFTDPPALVSN
jgi:hypothetical protein